MAVSPGLFCLFLAPSVEGTRETHGAAVSPPPRSPLPGPLPKLHPPLPRCQIRRNEWAPTGDHFFPPALQGPDIAVFPPARLPRTAPGCGDGAALSPGSLRGGVGGSPVGRCGSTGRAPGAEGAAPLSRTFTFLWLLNSQIIPKARKGKKKIGRKKRKKGGGSGGGELHEYLFLT